MSERYFVKGRDGERGPFSRKQLGEFLSRGKLLAKTLVRQEGSQTWQRTEGVLELDETPQTPAEPRLTDGDVLSLLEFPQPAASLSDGIAPNTSPASEEVSDEYHLAGEPSAMDDPLQCPCPICTSPLPKDAILCVRCGFDLAQGVQRECQIVRSTTQTPTAEAPPTSQTLS